MTRVATIPMPVSAAMLAIGVAPWLACANLSDAGGHSQRAAQAGGGENAGSSGDRGGGASGTTGEGGGGGDQTGGAAGDAGQGGRVGNGGNAGSGDGGAGAGGNAGSGDGGAGAGGNAGSGDGGSSGASGAPSGPLADRIGTSDVTISEGVKPGYSNFRIWGSASLGVAPVFTAPLANCGTLVCYTTGTADTRQTSGTSSAHVVRLDASDKVVATYDLGAFMCRGLAAEPDGHFAVLLWQPGSVSDCQDYTQNGRILGEPLRHRRHPSLVDRAGE